jgi:RNA polymerase sigma-70 factor, ECF subfamily
VLKFRAAEVATMLGITTTAVNSLLQRARTQLEHVPNESSLREPSDARQRELLDRYVRAFWDHDIATLIELFTKDAVWEMPPMPAWFTGADTIGQMIAGQSEAGGSGDQILVATQANSQPAFGLYMRDSDGIHRAYHIQVLTLTTDGIARVAAFFDTTLFPRFGLPDVYSRASVRPSGHPAL